MDTRSLIEALRATAGVLKPLARGALPGSKGWDGTRYAESLPKAADPRAQTWVAVLNTVADMLERQGIPATEEQLRYLRRGLFGGMGSLTDFTSDESLYGEEARIANQGLAAARDHLFQMFEELGDDQ